MYSKRLIEPTLNDALKSFPVVFIGGPRRSGKTTLVKHCCSKYKYVLLDEIDVRRFAATDPRGFLSQFSSPVIIDEIQHVPELLSYIKAQVDVNKKPGQWVLTGSQQWALMKNISETMAGRIAIMHLYPFTITEMQKRIGKVYSSQVYLKELAQRRVKPKKNITAGEWVFNGGYPEVLFGNKNSRKIWFASYVQTYVDRDVRGNIKEINLRDFERFVQLLATRTAQQLNTAALASDIGVSIPTINAWLSLLEASGLIFFLPSYHRNFGKRIIKSPKCYFFDTGLVCYLVGLNDPEHALKGPMGGALFETACVSQIYKRLSIFNEERFLYYFRSSDGVEVDLIIEQGNQCFPIEIKLSSTIDQHHIGNLIKWMTISKLQSTKGLVISTSNQQGLVAGNVQNVHFSNL